MMSTNVPTKLVATRPIPSKRKRVKDSASQSKEAHTNSKTNMGLSRSTIILGLVLLVATIKAFQGLHYIFELQKKQIEELSLAAALVAPETKPCPIVAPPSQGFPKCAINLYGLPRNFGNYVLPSLLKNVVKPNAQYGCDYFLHFFDVKAEAAGRSGQGGDINSTEVFLLRDAVHKLHKDLDMPLVGVYFSFDVEESFREARKDHLYEVVERYKAENKTNNPYVPERFPEQTMVNILKMWHSQTSVFELMIEHGRTMNQQDQEPYYERVAMLRSDVVFMSPIDIFRVTKVPVPRLDTTNTKPQDARTPTSVSVRTPQPASKSVLERWDKYQNRPGHYSMKFPKPKLLPKDYDSCKNPGSCYHDFGGTGNASAAVIPGFASWPINDRFIAGPYHAVKVWATERWNLYKDHVRLVLPKVGWTQYGIHDEKLLALTVVPEIRSVPAVGAPGTVDVVVDDSLYFLRVRADGTMLVYDSPYVFDKNKQRVLETTLGRPCNKPYTKLGVSKPMSYLIECPVL